MLEDVAFNTVGKNVVSEKQQTSFPLIDVPCLMKALACRLKNCMKKKKKTQLPDQVYGKTQEKTPMLKYLNSNLN